MAEQAQGKPEEKKRPQVRKVWLEPGAAVFFPDAGRLTGQDGKAEIDAEGNAAVAHKLALSVCPVGVVARYVGAKQTGAKPVDVPHRVLIPWGPIKLVEVDEEWKP